MPDWNDELQLFKEYKQNCKTFVETGSYAGDGIQKALDAGYENIISIELSQPHVEECLMRFDGQENIEIVEGDSADILFPTIENINERILFWLDGHYSCASTAKGKYWSPIMQELDAISKHTIKNHVIMIDDMRCWRCDNPEFKFDYRMIEDKISEINSEYQFQYFREKETWDEQNQKSWPEGLPGDILVAFVEEDYE